MPAVADLYAAHDYDEAAQDGMRRRLDEVLSEVFARLETFPRSAPLAGGSPMVAHGTQVT